MSATTREITLKPSQVTPLELNILENAAQQVSNPLRDLLMTMVTLLRDGKQVTIFVHSPGEGKK
jgi:hypothetical protein